MHRNACKPSGKFCLARELVKMLIRPDVGVLHDILSLPIIAQNSPGDAVEKLVVAPHDDLKHRSLARQYPKYNLFVTEGIERGRHFRRAGHYKSSNTYGVTKALKVTDKARRGAGTKKQMPPCNGFAPA